MLSLLVDDTIASCKPKISKMCHQDTKKKAKFFGAFFLFFVSRGENLSLLTQTSPPAKHV
jgi:hypothetical protein